MKHTTDIVMLVDAWFPSSDKGPGEFSGMQVHVHQLRRKLNKLGVNTELFFPNNPNPIIRWAWILIVIYQVIRYARQHPVELIHTHGVYSSIPGKVLSLILSVPIIHTVHRTADLNLGKKTPRAFAQWLTLTRINYDAQITISKSFLDVPNRNQAIHVIPNGINFKTFNSIRPKKNKQPTLIWVGRDHPSKGLEYLKKAIVRVRKTFPDLKAELVTGGRITGKELIKAYKKAHLFVLPSLHETQPISLLEAWAAKLPVVVTRVGDNARMVEDEVNGLLIEPANVTQLTDAILRILRARTFHKQIAKAGYNYVKKHHNWQEVARQTQDIYDQVISVSKSVEKISAQRAATS